MMWCVLGNTFWYVLLLVFDVGEIVTNHMSFYTSGKKCLWW